MSDEESLDYSSILAHWKRSELEEKEDASVLEPWERSDLRIGAGRQLCNFPTMQTNAHAVTVSDTEMVVWGERPHCYLFNIQSGQWRGLPPPLFNASRRLDIGAVCVDRVLYVVGALFAQENDGYGDDLDLAVSQSPNAPLLIYALELDNRKANWKEISSSPTTRVAYCNPTGDIDCRACMAAAKGSDIYIRGNLEFGCKEYGSDDEMNSDDLGGEGEYNYWDVLVFNTKTLLWKRLSPTRVDACDIIPGEDTLIWGNGDILDVKRGLSAPLPTPLDQTKIGEIKWCCNQNNTTTTLQNRFIVFVGDGAKEYDEERWKRASNAAIAFDWKTKRWFDLPRFKVARTGCSPAVVGRNLILTAGWEGIGGNKFSPMTEGYEVDIGIPWEKEKLLLMCFYGKAQRESEVSPACPLNKLEAGIFSHILRYLFQPFPSEERCKGSIFRIRDGATAPGDSIKLQISILRDEKEFVVIHKPCNLRSVPGNARHKNLKYDPEMDSGESDVGAGRERKRRKTANVDSKPEETRATSTSASEVRRAAQEAWILALESFLNDGSSGSPVTSSAASSVHSSLICSVLHGLADSSHNSIPRKKELFIKYVFRNQKRLLGNVDSSVEMNVVAAEVHEQIQARMKEYMNLPKATSPEESALGQLETRHNVNTARGGNLFHVVHRLDCETSGVMVFAKSKAAATFLCKAWREKSQRMEDYSSRHPFADSKVTGVEKVYLAVVREWPPLQNNEDSGIIDLPLEPSQTERLKWQVADAANPKAKPSQTEWRVLDANYCLPDWCESVYGTVECKHQNPLSPLSEKAKIRAKMTGIVLELRPITGRTHQLRVHCAHVGSGIVGDSLYGRDRISDTRIYDPNNAIGARDNGPHLMLHASKLTFPLPPEKDGIRADSSKSCTVVEWPSWYQPSL